MRSDATGRTARRATRRPPLEGFAQAGLGSTNVCARAQGASRRRDATSFTESGVEDSLLRLLQSNVGIEHGDRGFRGGDFLAAHESAGE